MSVLRCGSFGQTIEILEARIAPAFGALLDLSQLTLKEGFKITGASEVDFAGASVSDAGDMNGDGLSDMLVGAPLADPHGDASGAAYVIFGKRTGFPLDLDLSRLDGMNGFKLSGAAEENTFGQSVSGAGDVNGDGIDDILIGSDSAYSFRGATYVIFGSRSPFPRNVDVASLESTMGVKIIGAAAGDKAGGVVSGAGDVNGDGISDILIGAERPHSPGSARGSAYIVFGQSRDFPLEINLSTLDGSNGFEFRGDATSDSLGEAVSKAGDIDADGFGDVVIGAPRAVVDGKLIGAAYVVFGSGSPFPSVLEVSELDGQNGFQLMGVQDSPDPRNGDYVSAAGDLNGDGFDDFAIGAHSGDNYVGAAYVVFGKAKRLSSVFDLTSLDGTNGFTLHGRPFSDIGIGSSISDLGDMNGDGIGDLLIGADNARRAARPTSVPAGVAYVLFGKSGGFPAEMQLSELNGVNGYKLQGAKAGDYAGTSVSGTGDVNGDGWPDLLIGAPQADANGRSSGTVYVVFGGDPGRLIVAGDGHSATYTDPDGDKVTLRTSVGLFTHQIFETRADRLGFQLERLDLTDRAFAKATIEISAARFDANKDGMRDGNRRVDVGYIDATGVDLRSLTVAGDLARIDCGDYDPSTSGIKTLCVGSLGARGISTQDSAAANLHSDIAGDVKTFSVQRDVNDNVTFAVAGRIGTVTIGRDLKSARITALGSIEPQTSEDSVAIRTLTIRGNVTNSQILVGYDLTGAAENPDASIMNVKVGGNWSASDLVAGVVDATNDGFGRNDALISAGSSEIISSIAKLIIKGSSLGSTVTDEYFGITAETISRATVAGKKVALTANTDDVLLDSANRNLKLVEVQAN